MIPMSVLSELRLFVPRSSPGKHETRREVQNATSAPEVLPLRSKVTSGHGLDLSTPASGRESLQAARRTGPGGIARSVVHSPLYRSTEH